MDLITELKELALGSHMRRLLERMDKDISEIYRALGIDFEARWFSTLYLLKMKSPMTITGIAESLGYTHPGVHKIAREMSQKGLVVSVTDKRDRRKRLVKLSKKGREAAAFLSPVWDDIHYVLKELLASAEHNLLTAIEQIEGRLDEMEMYERLFERMKSRLLRKIEILDYRPTYKNKFKSLNYAWLKKNFTVDAHDEEILSDPFGKIIKPGGAVLFARLERRIVGTCALIKHEGDLFELSKMAVIEDSRKRLVGTKLTMAVIDKVKALGAPALYLETHPTFLPAQRLYESLGFRKVDSSPIPPRYRRRRVVMKLRLEPSS